MGSLGTLSPALPAWGLTVVHIGLAVLATGHVLLHKRDTRAAVGWIGLAWLSPIVGCVLYLLLGVNRVRVRAQTLRGTAAITDGPVAVAELSATADFTSVAIAGSRITGRPVVAGNTVDMLSNGDAAYPLMLDALACARTSIALSTFIFREDPAGVSFIEALANAAARGVEVRVLIDGIGGGYFLSSAFYALRQRGVPAVRFLHSAAPWRMPFLNLRNHRKMLIIDGRAAFTGGLNIGAENVLSAAPRHPVRDTHFRIEGPVTAQLMECFARDWQFAASEVLSGTVWFPAVEKVGISSARAVMSGPDEDLEKIELLITEAVCCARRSIRIMTPYFLPDERLMTALSLAAMRGVAVDIVLPERSNHPWLDWANRAHIDPLLGAGCRIYAQEAPFNHTKLLSIDREWCLIGSANWDTRSFTLNFEVNVEFYDEPLAGAIDGRVMAAMHREITRDEVRARPLARRLRDSAARLLSPYL